ncbi:protein trichome birefringence-like 34 isoform X2 [Capsicum annuum]|uniref:protein trichome birefringence-like 34 isoform X2 n=1 Tax=Capsicum annuum TaxID=4072 RepID=UPI001FB154E9|nr:protein trichome birefringence-like 34 isoform X2 [Capsicum annuum]
MVLESHIISLKEKNHPQSVICFLEVGFLIMSHILSTENNTVLSCLMTLLVINLEEKTQNFSIGDGDLMIVIFQECRFNGKALLEKLKGKRVVFVGDSLNKNQWASIVCLIESTGIPSLKPLSYKGNLIAFEVKEYNATIDFYWSPLLVESNCDDPVNHRIRDRIIRIEAIENHARHWNDADILIFDSFTWWHEHQMTLLWGSFNSSDAIYKKVGMKLRRYEMALRTWSDWLEVQIDRNRTRLFFMSLSPSHKNATDWGMRNDQTCYEETEPISRKEYWGSQTDRKMMEIAEASINGLKRRGLDIQYLNITQLSDYRKDAHPSIYKRNWVAPAKK